jgi:putative endonuclease
MRKSIELGKNGEKLIADFLIKEGYEVVARNWRIKGGEIDLIALAPDGLIVFVEVKM